MANMNTEYFRKFIQDDPYKLDQSLTRSVTNQFWKSYECRKSISDFCHFYSKFSVTQQGNWIQAFGHKRFSPCFAMVGSIAKYFEQRLLRLALLPYLGRHRYHPLALFEPHGSSFTNIQHEKSTTKYNNYQRWHHAGVILFLATLAALYLPSRFIHSFIH